VPGAVGIVAERDYLFGQGNDLPAIYQREVDKNRWIKEHLAPGTQFGEYRVTKEYSYRGEYCAEDGLVMVGDAFASSIDADVGGEEGVYYLWSEAEIDATLVLARGLPGFMFAVGNHIPANVSDEMCLQFMDYLRKNWAS